MEVKAIGGYEGRRVGKSGRVETNLLGCTGGVKATSRPCGVSEDATYLFDSKESSSLVSGVLVVACPLEALEVGLGHSFAMRPAAL